jgi:hypothetical protein
LEIGDSQAFTRTLVNRTDVLAPETLVSIESQFKKDQWYYWRVVAKNQFGETPPISPPARFKVNATLPALNETLGKAQLIGPKGELVTASLRGTPEPQIGKWRADTGWKKSKGKTGSESGSISVNGIDQKLRYSIDEWPEGDYSVSIWFRIEALPTNRIAQLFSGWCAGSDDPLRLVMDGGKLYARIEAGAAYSTKGIPIQPGQWRHAAAVKSGSKLSLYLDGQQKSTTEVPEYITTNARDFALGGNPHYNGNEHLAVHLSNFAFYARALSDEDIATLSR